MKALRTLRTPLLEVHRSLVQAERNRYERSHGRVSEGDFLQLLINDPQVAWLKPLTTLLASLDELLGDREFEKRYLEALQRDPSVAVAHGRLAAAAARR